MTPPIRKEDGIIDWNKSALAISCQIRALDPWPTAYTNLEDKRLRLFKPEVFERSSNDLPGKICQADKNGLLISCGQGFLRITEVQREGSKRMPVDAFLRGHAVAKETILG